MKQKAYFCWEKNFSGVWKPAVYWEYPPQKGIEADPERTPHVELKDEHMREDGTPDLERIAALFPAPVVPKDPPAVS